MLMWTEGELLFSKVWDAMGKFFDVTEEGGGDGESEGEGCEEVVGGLGLLKVTAVRRWSPCPTLREVREGK